ncbi:PQ loop repeat protein-like protein, partial [Glonium stellatum]
CKAIASPDVSNFVVSIILLVGILISYLPQHIKIIRRRSSRGLSPMFVLLGTVSGTAGIANILTLPASRADMGCCKEISTFACTAALLGIAQVGVQWTCFFFIMLLFLIFFPRRVDGVDEPDLPTWVEAIVVLSVSMAFFIAVFIASVVFIYAQPDHLQGWANFLGITGTILASLQYLPQIWTTWKLQHVMSLSIPMMCIQTPGSFVWAASLAARLGPEGWSAWGLYCVTGCLQGVLLCMGISFWLRDRRQASHESEGGPSGS